MTTEAVEKELNRLAGAVINLAAIMGARLTRSEVCQRFNIHRNTLPNWIEDRGFPRPGRDGKWLLADVLEWEGRKPTA